MKIISGIYKGREIEGHQLEGTRPTQDRVKESLFAMIQNYIRESTILDLFTGSGNLGIEALSNGSKFAYLVDNSKTAINTVNKNLKKLNIDNALTLTMDYKKALEHFQKEQITFDLIFLDPPYDLKCLDDIISDIINKKLLNEEGIIVCEYEYEQLSDNYETLELIKSKKYGYKKIKIFQKNS